MRSDKVHNTISIHIDLLSRRRHNAMLSALQHAICERHHCIAEVYNSVARQRLHVRPFSLLGLVLGLDLESSEPIEEDGDAAEVGVRGQADGMRVGDVCEFVGDAAVVAGRFGEDVLVGEFFGCEIELLGERAEHEHTNVVSVLLEGSEEGL